MCSDDNALLDDAGKNFTNRMFKKLSLGELCAGCKQLSKAGPVWDCHQQEACSKLIHLSVCQTITNFFAKAELDNGADGKCD